MSGINHLTHLKKKKTYFRKCWTFPLNIELTIFLACSSQSGVWCVISNTGMEHCWPSANLAVQLAKSCWERFNRMSTENNKGNNTILLSSECDPGTPSQTGFVHHRMGPKTKIDKTTFSIIKQNHSLFSALVVTSCTISDVVERIRWKQCWVKGRALLLQAWPFVLPVQVPVSVFCCLAGATL